MTAFAGSITVPIASSSSDRQPTSVNPVIATFDGGPGDAMGNLLAPICFAIAIPRRIEGGAENVLGVIRQMMPDGRWQIIVGRVGHA